MSSKLHVLVAILPANGAPGTQWLEGSVVPQLIWRSGEEKSLFVLSGTES